MKLTLRIENFDFLPDGGPLEFSVVSRGCEVGRDPAMDWTLPDPTRHISSRHFEVIYREKQFWLTDISTNGTFVYGAQMRVSSPVHLSNNDRLQVGQYIIRVMIVDDVVAYPPAQNYHPAQNYNPAQSFAPTPPPPAADPWSLTPTPAPMPTPMAPPQRPLGAQSAGGQSGGGQSGALAGAYGDSFIEAPRPVAARPTESPAHMPMMGGAATPQPMPPAAPPAVPLAAPLAASEPFVLKPQPAAPTAPPVAAVAPGEATSGLLDAICRGAGLPAGALNSVPPGQLGEDIGRCLRIATEELMALLGARAAAKQFVKSASRTMIGGMNNSPLKFKPSAEEAMLTMFGKPTGSYLSSTASFQLGFDDIKRHQTAVYAAMQPALARLLEDLSPESIEGRASGGLMTSKKSRAWETFVERWDAKTHPYENGMLDVFLAYFADAYDVAVKKTGG